MIGFNGGLIGKNNPTVAGQSIAGVWDLREQEVAVRRGQWAATLGLLDLYPGAKFAYSLRLLRAAYTGPVVTVIRSSDSTSINCTAAQVRDGTLTSFCSGTDGFVTTWYDQTVTANHATDGSVSTRRPQIVSNGALIENGSPALPVLRFDGNSDYLTQTSGSTIPQAYTTIMALKRTGGTGSQNIFRSGGNSVPYFDGDSLLLYAGGGATIGSTPNNTRFLSSIVWNGSSTTSRFNGTSTTYSPGTLGLSSGAAITIGSAGGAVLTTMDMHELIIYDSNQTSNLNAIDSNVNVFYGIY